MIQNFARGNGQAKGVKRVIGIVVAAALAVSGVQAVASAQTGAAAGAPYNPVDEYTGFNVVTFDDLHLDAVVEGPVAVGGQLSWGHTQINIRQDAEAALVVKGGIDWPNSSGVLHVNGTQGWSPTTLSISTSSAAMPSIGRRVARTITSKSSKRATDITVFLASN